MFGVGETIHDASQRGLGYPFLEEEPDFLLFPVQS